MANLCVHCGKYPIFSHKHCKYCQRYRTDKDTKPNGFKPYKARSTSGQVKIPPISDKRLNEGKLYHQVCKELEREIRESNNGRIYCFFSGDEITERIAWHHVRGRRGSLLTDKRWLVPTINTYHLMYHHTPIEILSKESWYSSFLSRLKNLPLGDTLLAKEMKKFDKAGIKCEIIFV